MTTPRAIHKGSSRTMIFVSQAGQWRGKLLTQLVMRIMNLLGIILLGWCLLECGPCSQALSESIRSSPPTLENGKLVSGTGWESSSENRTSVFEGLPLEYLGYYFPDTLYLVLDLCKYGPVTYEVRRKACNQCFMDEGESILSPRLSYST